VLLTTYTANLAENISHNLDGLCGDERKKIEVVHLHAWAVRFMQDHGFAFDVASHEDLDRCWEDAVLAAEDIDFDLGFLRQEWERVVQANDIETEADYLKVPRIGRGQTLSRPQRSRVWKVFEKFRLCLHNVGKTEWKSVIQRTRRFLEDKRPGIPYLAVVVDEAQDFHAEEWRLIRAIAPPGPNDLFIVGDAHQRIYGPKVTLRGCGVNVQGRSSKLRINYRTTEQIRAWAMAVLHGIDTDDLDGERDEEQGYKSLLSGPKPEVRHFGTKAEECAFLGQRIKDLVADRPPEEVCLVARTNKMLRDDYQPVLKDLGVRHTLLDKNRESQGVRLATMHRVKGLEFPIMILAGVSASVLPLKVPAAESDAAAWAEHVERERSLLFVAATRARDLLVVTSWGKPSLFLAGRGGRP
jgi:superfamily I DNA/RNA helicase